MKAIVRLHDHLASAMNRRIFLLRCRSNGVFPPHLENLLKDVKTTCNLYPKFQQNLENPTTRYKKTVLNIEISNCIHRISVLNKDITHNLNRLQALIPDPVIVQFKIDTLKHFQDEHKKIKVANVRKFNHSINHESVKAIGNDDWFVNLTKHEIPLDIRRFLSLGPKFALPSTHDDFPVDQIISDVELFVQDNVKTGDQEQIRGKCVNVITNHIHKIKSDRHPSELTKLYNRTKSYLKLHPDIVITHTDKSNQTVAIDKHEYFSKVNDLLKDKDTYSVVGKNPSKAIETENNEIVEFLLDKRYISQFERNRMYTKTSTVPRMYALVKTHKPGNPARPIVSYVTAPTYGTSQHLANILKNLSNSKYNVTDSFDFKNKISQVRVPDNYEIISLDVSALFTNLPIPLITKILKDNWETIKIHTKIPKTHFFRLLNLCIKDGHFQFDSKIYKQKFGLPMGSPIAPVVADLCLNFFLDQVIPTLPFRVPFVYKYVDDHLLAIPKNSAHIVLSKFNKFNERLQFTIEFERVENNLPCIPFLDVFLIRNPDGSIDTKWWRKPQNKGRCINYHSDVPYHQKINLAKNLINRSKKLSSPKFHKEIENKVVDSLLLNDFPHKLICDLLKKNRIVPSNTDDPPSPVKFYTLPFINNLSQKLNKILTENRPNVKFAYKNHKTLNKIFTNMKDPIPHEMKSHLIYGVPCECGKSYFGRTDSHLKTRIYSHKYSIDKMSNDPSKKDPTALTTHARSGHNLKFHKTKILDYERNFFKSGIKEMIAIERNKHIAINKKTDVQNLSKCYGNLIHVKIKP